VSDPRARAPEPASPAGPSAPAPPAGRRRVLPAALLVLGIALGAGGGELLDAQRERAAREAAGEVLDLRLMVDDGRLDLSFGGTQLTQPASGVEVGRLLQVRNAGPRPVQVLGAELGSYSAPAPAGTTAAGDGVVLDLSTRPVCAPGGPPQVTPAGSVLRLRARIEAGERSVDLPVPDTVLQELQSAAADVCGYVPVSSALGVRTVRGLRQGERLDVRLSLTSSTAARLRLLTLYADVPGFRATLRRGQGRSRLPLTVPAASGNAETVGGTPDEPLLLDVELRVSDCGAVRDSLAGLVPGSGLPLLALTYDVEGFPEQGSSSVSGLSGLRELVDDTCG